MERAKVRSPIRLMRSKPLRSQEILEIGAGTEDRHRGRGAYKPSLSFLKSRKYAAQFLVIDWSIKVSSQERKETECRRPSSLG